MNGNLPQRAAWERDGFFILHGFADGDLAARMLDRVIEIARTSAGPIHEDGMIIAPESNLRDALEPGAHPEELVSKVFRLHRDPIFREFIGQPAFEKLLTPLLGDAIDCFLSQFIFKNPGAWGQPWHQDEFYFPFDRNPQIGVWLAVTEATLTNGCLHVLPGSHREPVHEHVQDRREHANFGYVEIVDQDFRDAVPVLMDPGDLLVFHSRLMHCSLDNQSEGIRAAMVYHFAEHGTIESPNPAAVNDWLQILPAE